MNKHVHPLFQSIVAPVTPRNPFQEASQKLASQEQDLAFKTDVIRAQALRIEALKTILEDIAPSDMESEEEATYGMRIPQTVVIDAIKELMRIQHVEFAGILETKFAEWVKRERDAADIAAWEDQQS